MPTNPLGMDDHYPILGNLKLDLVPGDPPSNGADPVLLQARIIERGEAVVFRCSESIQAPARLAVVRGTFKAPDEETFKSVIEW